MANAWLNFRLLKVLYGFVIGYWKIWKQIGEFSHIFFNFLPFSSFISLIGHSSEQSSTKPETESTQVTHPREDMKEIEREESERRPHPLSLSGLYRSIQCFCMFLHYSHDSTMIVLMTVPCCTHIVVSFYVILFSLVVESREAVATGPFQSLNQTELNAWKNRRHERRAVCNAIRCVSGSHSVWNT